MISEFNTIGRNFAVNDTRDANNQQTFKENERERDDLADRCTQLENKLMDTKEYLELKGDDQN